MHLLIYHICKHLVFLKIRLQMLIFAMLLDVCVETIYAQLLLCIYTVNFATAVYFPSLSSHLAIIRITGIFFFKYSAIFILAL